jgi:hypothetical protein
MICNKEDEFLEDKTIWVAVLSNDEIVYQDDNRETEEEKSAWLRLKKYISNNKLKIKSFYLKFRSNTSLLIPNDASGYFFSKGIMASVSNSKTVFYYSIGYIENASVHIKKVKIPELIIFDQETRKIYDCNEEQLIFN